MSEPDREACRSQGRESPLHDTESGEEAAKDGEKLHSNVDGEASGKRMGHFADDRPLSCVATS